MKILGISAYYHDSAAALLVDGTLVAAAQEERFSRRKHDDSFPAQATLFCLKQAGQDISEIDAVVFFEKPFLKFERILVSQIASFPRSFPMFMRTMPHWLRHKLNMRHLLRREMKDTVGSAPSQILFAEHHLCHAALAHCTAPNDRNAVLVADAVGEWATTSIMQAKGDSLIPLREQRFPDSIGLFYSSVTQFLGFRVNSDEYKVMGLAPYGDALSPQTRRFTEIIRRQLLKVCDGFPCMNLKYFAFQYGDRMIRASRWERLFGFPMRKHGEGIRQCHSNLALAAQRVTEEMLLSLANRACEAADTQSLALCGGVALNCAANGLLLTANPNREIYVPFAPGDCGCAIGAALVAQMHFAPGTQYHLSPYTGPEFSDSEIEETLRSASLHYIRLPDNDTLCRQTASLIAQGMIIGWFQGRMEFGPRALGNRCILADARRPQMKDAVNARIKFREPFRPFAPSVLQEYAPSLFEGCMRSPYMMLTFPAVTDTLPAVTHVDGTSRVQTVSLADNPLYYRLLKAFYELTGCPAVLNTSFNVMGEPMVCTPADAVHTFKKSGLHYLIIGHFIVKK